MTLDKLLLNLSLFIVRLVALEFDFSSELFLIFPKTTRFDVLKSKLLEISLLFIKGVRLYVALGFLINN